MTEGKITVNTQCHLQKSHLNPIEERLFLKEYYLLCANSLCGHHLSWSSTTKSTLHIDTFGEQLRGENEINCKKPV